MCTVVLYSNPNVSHNTTHYSSTIVPGTYHSNRPCRRTTAHIFQTYIHSSVYKTQFFQDSAGATLQFDIGSPQW